MPGTPAPGSAIHRWADAGSGRLRTVPTPCICTRASRRPGGYRVIATGGLVEQEVAVGIGDIGVAGGDQARERPHQQGTDTAAGEGEGGSGHGVHRHRCGRDLALTELGEGPGDDRFELDAVEGIQQAGGDHDGGRGRRFTDHEHVGPGILEHEHVRDRHTARGRQPVGEVEEAGVGVGVGRPRPEGREHPAADAGGERPGPKNHHDRGDDQPGSSPRIPATRNNTALTITPRAMIGTTAAATRSRGRGGECSMVAVTKGFRSEGNGAEPTGRLSPARRCRRRSRPDDPSRTPRPAAHRR